MPTRRPASEPAPDPDARDGIGHGRGRHARRPLEIPPSGWRDVLVRVSKELKKDNLSLIASGVAFYAFLALFPAIASALSLYGLMADPATLQAQLSDLATYLPEQARPVVEDQLLRVAAGPRPGLTWGALISLAVTLWAASRGTKGMIRGLNIAYDEPEGGHFLVLQLKAILLTLGGIVLVAVALSLIAVLPAILKLFGLPAVATIVGWVRWPLLALMIISGLAILYRFGPARRQARWRWLSWGSIAATTLWMIASAGFSIYVANFGRYHETYGSIGGIIILLLWLQISAYSVLLGAELNAEIEAQTAVDSTVGPERPMGRRGAQKADHLGPDMH